jgi:hypothetical protein
VIGWLANAFTRTLSDWPAGERDGQRHSLIGALVDVIARHGSRGRVRQPTNHSVPLVAASASGPITEYRGVHVQSPSNLNLVWFKLVR